MKTFINIKEKKKTSGIDSTYVTNLVAIAELFHHNTKSACRNVIAGIHARVCRSNYWHNVIPVPVVSTRIPYREMQSILFDRA